MVDSTISLKAKNSRSQNMAHLIRWQLCCFAFIVFGEMLTLEDELALDIVPPQIYGNLSVPHEVIHAQNLLQPRQACPAGYGRCSITGSCCAPNSQCCESGYCGLPRAAGECCGVSQCLASDGTPKCCQNRYCIAAGAQCCDEPGRTCPSGFLCGRIISYRNLIPFATYPACCDSPQCTAFLSGSVIVPVSPEATNVATTTANTIVTTRVITQATTATTATTGTAATTAVGTAQTTTGATGITSLQLYTTLIIWSYRSQYYTLRTILSAVTSRTVTIVTTTTTVAASATDRAQANDMFFSSSIFLTAPTDVTVPVTPTAGALIRGSCSTTTIFQTTHLVCETLTAGSAVSTTNSGLRSASSSLLKPQLLVDVPVLMVSLMIYLCMP